MAHPDRVGLVVNPVHPAGARAAEEVIALAVEAGHALPRLAHTTITEPGGPQARRLVDLGCTDIVAIGGDGTVREVAYAVAGTGARLGVVPTGTANLFARNLGLPRRAGDQVRVAVRGTARTVDLGVAQVRDDGGWGAELPFLAYAGIGEDAATVADTRPGWKSRLGPLGWLAYLEAGARHLARGGHPMTITYAGSPAAQRRAWCVLAGNTGRIPAGIAVFPDARLDDGLLHVLEVTGGVQRWPLVAAEGVTHRPVAGSGLARRTGSTVEVTTPEPLAVHLDGDVVGHGTGARFGVRPGALEVRAAR